MVARPNGGSIRGALLFLFLVAVLHILVTNDTSFWITRHKHHHAHSERRRHLAEKCAAMREAAGPPTSFRASSRIRTGSDRWVRGTPPTLLRNAKIWTGARNGTEVVYGDVLLDKGLVFSTGFVPPQLLALVEVESGQDLVVKDVGGRWVTPGLVDLHSHIGVYSSPGLSGALDGNSYASPIVPWVRSIDALNTHDASYQLAVSGGVTTAQILPGSADNIGGQAFVIKLRETAEKSPTSKIIEPPTTLHTRNDTVFRPWRHMKHACGENPDRIYGQSRMDAQWNFRKAYDEARKILQAQEAFCDKVERRDWDSLRREGLDDVPEDLQWESLVDVLRGRVKLSIHCYEAVDLDGIVRLSNEFKFPVASFHHAGETYLVPDLLKKTWGGTPTVALFASNFRKKREAYRGSEFAPRILSDHNISVVMKSDHPVVNSRYLLYEAQQAHYYGLSAPLALSSVTSIPARAAGLDHRIGTIAEGFDADIVVWDSHPLALGATPVQVYIDGIAQISEKHTLVKPESFQHTPKVPNFDKEREETVKWDGLPPLPKWDSSPGKKIQGAVRLTGVKNLIVHGHNSEGLKTSSGLKTLLDLGVDDDPGKSVFVEGGNIVCVETDVESCYSFTDRVSETIDLNGGSVMPGLTTFGGPLGLVEIRLERSTNDGPVMDPLTHSIPSIIGDRLVRAVDGLLFGGRNTLLAYKYGVSTAITAPVSTGFLSGVATAFSLGAPHGLVEGAVRQRETGVHITISPSLKPSVSTQVHTLRHILFGHSQSYAEDEIWARVRKGEVPIVIWVESADIMAILIRLKMEYEASHSIKLWMTFVGASEAHLLADEIAAAGISVVITSVRPYPGSWEQRRALPGPPLSKKGSVATLLEAGVNVAIGVNEESSARNTWFELGWIALESNETLSREQTIALATVNLHKALGYETQGRPELFLHRGGKVSMFEGKVVGVLSPQRGLTEMFEQTQSVQ